MLGALLASAAAQEDPCFEEHLIASVPDGVEVAGHIEFATDGSRVAYVGSREGKSVPVIDAEVYDAQWYVGRPQVAADGRVAFRVIKPPEKDRHVGWVLLDGKRLRGSNGCHDFAWSPDGKRFAYVAFPECKIAPDRSITGDCILVIDRKKGSKWHGLTAPVWSSDSKHVLSIAEGRGKTCILRDNKEIVEGGRYDGPVFSPDGRRIAYACELLVDGKFAADPESIKWYVACDDLRLGLNFDRAGFPVFSPDGKRIAFKAEQGGRVGISINGAVPTGMWSFVTAPVFSPDGAHMAFTASDDCRVEPGTQVTHLGEDVVSKGTWQLIVDGKPTGDKYAAIRDLTFSSDSKLLAFRAYGGKWRIVCGDVKSEEFSFVGPPQFAPDGKRIAFGVLAGRDFLWKVLALE